MNGAVVETPQYQQLTPCFTAYALNYPLECGPSLLPLFSSLRRSLVLSRKIQGKPRLPLRQPWIFQVPFF